MQLNSNQIAQILPQSYPFLMIDRVVDFKKGESLTAIKNITGNEWVFEGQCRPPAEQESPWGTTNIFPETLLIEAAAQAALILYHLSKIKEGEKHPRYILGKLQAEFKTAVFVGDQLEIKAYATKLLYTGGYSDVEITVKSSFVSKMLLIFGVER